MWVFSLTTQKKNLLKVNPNFNLKMVVINCILTTFNYKVNTILLFTIVKLWNLHKRLSSDEYKAKCDGYAQ